MGGTPSSSGDFLQRARTLIDGYNLMHAIGLVRPRAGGVSPASDGELQRARSALLELLAESLSADDARRTVIVFDAVRAPQGLPRELQAQGITILFSSDHEDADALLEELIARHSVPRAVTMVSSDHRVQRAAKRRKARAVDSEAWYEELLRQRQERGRMPAPRAEGAAEKPARDANANDLASSDETEYWLRQFASELPDDAMADDAGAHGAPDERPVAGASRATEAQETEAQEVDEPPPSRRSPAAPPRRPPRRGAKPSPRAAPRAMDDWLNPFPPGYTDDVWAEEGVEPPDDDGGGGADREGAGGPHQRGPKNN